MGRSEVSHHGQQSFTVPVEDDDARNTKFNLEEQQEDLQPGVRKIEAITQTWSRRSLWLTFIWYSFAPAYSITMLIGVL